VWGDDVTLSIFPGVSVHIRSRFLAFLAARLSAESAPPVSGLRKRGRPFPGVQIAWSGDLKPRDPFLLIVGIVDVSPGHVWSGPATPFSKEAYALKRYHQDAADCFSIRVERVFELTAPVPLKLVFDQRGDLRTPKLEHARFTPYGLSALLEAQGRDMSRASGETCIVRHALAAWGHGDVDIDKVPLHAIVKPVADLVLKRRWSELLLLARWHLHPPLFSDFPPGQWLQNAHPHQDSGVIPCEITSHRVAELCENLRRWKPAILAAANDADDANSESMTLDMALPTS
jgi:hypothetical protein